MVEYPIQLAPIRVAIMLNLYFNVHTRWKVQSHEHIDGFGIRVQNIDQAVMCADFKMLVRIFIDECRAPNCKPFFLSWQGYRTNYSGTRSFCCLHDTFRGLIQNAVIISLQTNTDLLFSHMSYSNNLRIMQ